ncbi:MAG: hypothetical protein GWN64_14805 [Candidatus Thorarchaeota archaeon]|nr:hypothetical protein [Candidatus Thorarchaeota archaeon]
MCGIVGAIGTGIDVDLLFNLLLETEARGTDATGFWTPNTGIVKAPKKASVFLTEQADTFSDGVENSQIFLGHTRHATHGKPEDNFNNHPLESENWIMVHNGVVPNMKDIKEYPYTSDTDTENLLAYIEQFGLEEGLSYCASGAAILFVNKAEEDTLYLWRTISNPAKLVYDIDKETIYVISEEKFLWASLDEEIKEKELLGGLFVYSIIDRNLKITSLEERELWKIQIKEDKLECEMVADVSTKYTNTNSYQSRWNGNHYHGMWDYRQQKYVMYDKKEEDDGIFCANRQGIHRPRVIKYNKEQAQKKDEDTTKQGRIKNKLTNESTFLLLPEDVVKLKRPIQATDSVQTSGGCILDLTTKDRFTIRKYLTNDRVAVNDIDGVFYVFPTDLVEAVPPPSCMGLKYDSHSSQCEECLFSLECAGIHYSSIGVDLPECVGGFDSADDQCTICEFLVACITEKENGTGEYIDTDFSEANAEIITGEESCAK